MKGREGPRFRGQKAESSNSSGEFFPSYELVGFSIEEVRFRSASEQEDVDDVTDFCVGTVAFL